MADLVEQVGLAELLQESGIENSSGQNFELIYESLVADASKAEVVRTMEARIRDYFAGIVISPKVTLYDKLLLSLRPKDFIATFNWDPLLVQAFKRNRSVKLLPRVLFLHGSVDAGACNEHRQKGFLDGSCSVCRCQFGPVPLLYPIGRKNYETDPFIANEWMELREAMQNAYILTIFGYSAPASDVAAREVMLEAWKMNETRELAEIDIIDIKDKSALETSWSPFFVRSHYLISKSPYWLFQHPRRSSDHLAMATLQNRPCHERPLPDITDLAELQEWIQPLLDEEIKLEKDGTPFPC